MEFDFDKAQILLDGETGEAQDAVRDPSRMDAILMQLEEKLKAVPAIGNTLADVPLMIAMIKAWIREEYTAVSPKVIVCLVASILYLLKRRDLIHDGIPVVGIADDLAVMALALKLSEPELKAFAQWRASQGDRA